MLVGCIQSPRDPYPEYGKFQRNNGKQQCYHHATGYDAMQQFSAAAACVRQNAHGW